MNKKIIKKCLNFARAPRGCDVARKATWQRHADPRSAYMAHDIYFIYIIVNVKGLQPFVYGKGYYPYELSGLINLTKCVN